METGKDGRQRRVISLKTYNSILASFNYKQTHSDYQLLPLVHTYCTYTPPITSHKRVLFKGQIKALVTGNSPRVMSEAVSI